MEGVGCCGTRKPDRPHYAQYSPDASVAQASIRIAPIAGSPNIRKKDIKVVKE